MEPQSKLCGIHFANIFKIERAEEILPHCMLTWKIKHHLKKRAQFLMILAGILHLWAIVIAYSVEGFIAGIVTFFLPIISAMYWFFVLGSMVGFFTKYHTFAFVVAILLLGMLIKPS
jgi:hypothetical protein